MTLGFASYLFFPGAPRPEVGQSSLKGLPETMPDILLELFVTDPHVTFLA